MRKRAFGARRGEGRRRAWGSDELFEANWTIVVDLVTSTSKGDPVGRADAIRRLQQDVPPDWRAAMCVGYLLWLHVRYLHGGRQVDSRDLDRLAQLAYPRFSAIVNGDLQLLRDTLETVSGDVEENHLVSGTRLILYGSAVLGVLLDDAPTRLQQMRPLLEKYYKAHEKEFTADHG